MNKYILFKSLYLSILLIIKSSFTLYAFDRMLPGIGGQGMGLGVFPSAPWAVFRNPGQLPLAGAGAIAFFYRNRFLIKELQEGALGFGMARGRHGLGLGFSSFGLPQFREHSLHLAYGFRIHSRFSAGLSIYGLLLQAEGEKIYLIPGFRLGFRAEPHRNLSLGFLLLNGIPWKISEEGKERLPIQFQLALAWQPLDKLRLGLEFSMQTGSSSIYRTDPPEFSLGLEYLPHPRILLQAGFAGPQPSPALCIGYSAPKLFAEAGARWRAGAGFMPEAEIRIPLPPAKIKSIQNP